MKGNIKFLCTGLILFVSCLAYGQETLDESNRLGDTLAIKTKKHHLLMEKDSIQKAKQQKLMKNKTKSKEDVIPFKKGDCRYETLLYRPELFGVKQEA